MLQLRTPAYADPLDLLRRFVPTPLKAGYRFGDSRVIVQTNDFSLLPNASSAVSLPGILECDFAWILVRDPGATGPPNPPMLLTSGAVTIVQMGSACLIGVDQERHELVAFIGADVYARMHQNFLVPLFCRLTNEGMALRSLLELSNARKECGP
jgi:hypothetical protein